MYENVSPLFSVCSPCACGRSFSPTKPLPPAPSRLHWTMRDPPLQSFPVNRNSIWIFPESPGFFCDQIGYLFRFSSTPCLKRLQEKPPASARLNRGFFFKHSNDCPVYLLFHSSSLYQRKVLVPAIVGVDKSLRFLFRFISPLPPFLIPPCKGLCPPAYSVRIVLM